MVSLIAHAAYASPPGRASVEWISSSVTVEPGKPLMTALRMKHDDGWHSYWINPGEAGMPTSAKWNLPPGWQNGGLEFPVPKRFFSAGLAGFGYEGEVLLPVTLVAPADFSGKARLGVTLAWLACGEDGCVPGEKELFLELRAGRPASTEHQNIIEAFQARLPQANEAVMLQVTEKPEMLSLSISAGPSFTADLAACDVFFATPEVVDPHATPRFRKEDDSWVAEAPLGAFVQKPVKHLELVLHGKGLKNPILVKWTAP